MITFLLTDVEGSTRRWEEDPAGMAAALEQHDALIDDAVVARSGTVIKTKGEGDSTFSVFDDAADAVAAAIDAQQRLAAASTLRVRMAIHTGPAETRGGDYYGPTVNRCARLRGAAHGGQVVISNVVAQLVRDRLAGDVTLIDLGVHRLRDLAEPEHVFQLAHADLERDFPPLASLDVRRDNLRPALTTFVGREAELEDLERLVTTERLITLVGPGGAGKTRLAVELARRVVDRFPDGAWVVELASVEEPAHVETAVAATLGVRDTLETYLETKRALLILDNCEHVADAAADVARLVLESLGSVAVATSRQALQLRGERVWPVRPLSVEREAVELFAERAARIDPGFVRDAVTMDAVERICRSVDGLPLAIELAAARLDALSAPQIADRLDRTLGGDDRYELLAVDTRNTEPRQQTLANTIAWSYDLLSEEERAAFAAFAVFPGGFDIGAAEAVMGPRAIPALRSLVGKSLVGRDDERYSMLETVRTFAAEKLAGSGRAGEVHERVVDWALEVSHNEDLELLDTERDNLLAALHWSIARRPADSAPIANALGVLWEHRGVAEGRRIVDDALAVASAADPRSRSRLLRTAGRLALNAGDMATAEAHQRAALALAEQVGDTILMLHSHSELGRLAHLRGDVDGARAEFETALALSQSCDDHAAIAGAFGNLAILAHAVGDLDAARDLLDQGVKHARASGHTLTMARMLDNQSMVLESAGLFEEARAANEEALRLVGDSGSALQMAIMLSRRGSIATRLGDFEASRAALEESVELFRGLGDQLTIANVLYELGTVATREQRYDDARKALQESLDRFRELDHALGEAALVMSLGELDFLCGDDAGALARIHRCLPALHELKSREGVGEGLLLVAAIAARRGDAAIAAELVGAADALREAMGVSADDAGYPVDRPALADALGNDYADALARGRRLTEGDAVARAVAYGK
jgi:predicted ATPase/class 3 adenylate cyclase